MKNSGKSNQSSRNAANAIVTLLDSVGKIVHLETIDGTLREGRLSGFNCRGIILNGVKFDLPLQLEINGDITDVIALTMIEKIDIDS